jgi:IS30 family transposase
VAHIEERTELGPWAGDLIIGNVSTAMATLVERMTRYTVLVQLPGSRTIDVPNEALEAVDGSMPEPLIRTLTWDQGEEIAGHENVAEVGQDLAPPRRQTRARTDRHRLGC